MIESITVAVHTGLVVVTYHFAGRVHRQHFQNAHHKLEEHYYYDRLNLIFALAAIILVTTLQHYGLIPGSEH